MSAVMCEEKKSVWTFDFLSKDSVEDFTGSVVRAENLCNYLVHHLPSKCDSVTQFAVANMVGLAEHSLNIAISMLVNYQNIVFDVLKSNSSSEAGSSE